MPRISALLFLAMSFSALLATAQNTPAPQPTGQWTTVEQALGRSGTVQPDGTFKVSMPRRDLKVTVDGTSISAGLALGSWVAFNGTPIDAMVMGDLVLTEDEVGPVMLKLQQQGLEQTALHNHLLHETPRIMYMHIEGHGQPTKLASAIRAALALTRTPELDIYISNGAPFSLDAAHIQNVLGHKGKLNAGVFQIAVPRSETITDNGMPVPSSMGTATSINFQQTGTGKAAIAGDFVLLPDEVNPVIKALRDNGIQVTAIHSHMLHDQPRLIFMHFWANDDAMKLARGLRAALDLTKSNRAEPVGR